jgi:5-methylcytosine-specific restriction endonuclease McrA
MPKFTDLTGKRFSYLVVLGKEGHIGRGIRYKCRCDCGNITYVSANNLKSGSIKSCGCKQFSVLADRFTKNEVGNRFGRLVAVEMIRKPKITGGRKNGNQIYFRCVCDCGREVEVWGAHLRAGKILSCGCYGVDQRRKAVQTHGLSSTKEYNSARGKVRRDMEKVYDSDWTYEKEKFLRTLFQECVVCGMTEQEHQEKYGRSLCVDHVMPLVDKNKLDVGNATILCVKCNSAKADRSLDDLPERTRNRIKLTADLFKLLWEGT